MITDARLLKIVKDYQEHGYPSFAMLWQPATIALSQWPIEAVSQVDCFHPSVETHERIAAGVWNRLTLGPVRYVPRFHTPRQLTMMMMVSSRADRLGGVVS